VLVGYNLKAAEILAEEGIDAEVGHLSSLLHAGLSFGVSRGCQGHSSWWQALCTKVKQLLYHEIYLPPRCSLCYDAGDQPADAQAHRPRRHRQVGVEDAPGGGRRGGLAPVWRRLRRGRPRCCCHTNFGVALSVV
jgi:hypothetical protein